MKVSSTPPSRLMVVAPALVDDVYRDVPHAVRHPLYDAGAAQGLETSCVTVDDLLGAGGIASLPP